MESNMIEKIKKNTADIFRKSVREGVFTGQTSGQAPNCLQGNIVILPYSEAVDFLRYCLNNPKPCPLVGLSALGEKSLPHLGKDINICTDIPKYSIFKHGTFSYEKNNIDDLWQNNFVTFVLGCSFTFEQALISSGYSIRHIEQKQNVPMYSSNIPSVPSGKFFGNVVVTMRPIKKDKVWDVYGICSKYPHAHGTPIYHGNPEKIGIYNLNAPDYGDIVEVLDDEIPVFWACGVTTQVAINNAKPPLCITHAPGHMLVTDIPCKLSPIIADDYNDITNFYNILNIKPLP